MEVFYRKLCFEMRYLREGLAMIVDVLSFRRRRQQQHGFPVDTAEEARWPLGSETLPLGKRYIASQIILPPPLATLERGRGRTAILDLSPRPKQERGQRGFVCRTCSGGR